MNIEKYGTCIIGTLQCAFQHFSQLEISRERSWAHRLVYVSEVCGLSKYYFVSPVVLIKVWMRVGVCNSRDSWSPCPNSASMPLMPAPGMGKARAESHSGFPQPIPRSVIKKATLIQLTQAAEVAFSWMSWGNGKDACSYFGSSFKCSRVPGNCSVTVGCASEHEVHT